jgi:hypothetical protein
MVGREKHDPPMTLANMRRNGVHNVIATCEISGHKADPNVAALPETLVVPRPADDSGAASAEGNGSIPDPPGMQCDQIAAFASGAASMDRTRASIKAIRPPPKMLFAPRRCLESTLTGHCRSRPCGRRTGRLTDKAKNASFRQKRIASSF